MKLACMTCSSRYDIPDARLDAAGRNGLRVRCAKCRAIMVVTAPGATDDDAGADAQFASVPDICVSGSHVGSHTPAAAGWPLAPNTPS